MYIFTETKAGYKSLFQKKKKFISHFPPLDTPPASVQTRFLSFTGGTEYSSVLIQQDLLSPAIYCWVLVCFQFFNIMSKAIMYILVQIAPPFFY